MNLSDNFLGVADRQPAKTAILYGETQVNYQAIGDQILAISRLLRATHGIRPGDRVGIWLKNRPEFVTALFGVLHAGGVVFPVNHFLKPEEVEYILRDAGIRVVISEEAFRSEASAVAALGLPIECVWIETLPELTPDHALGPDRPVRTEEDLAILVYTS